MLYGCICSVLLLYHKIKGDLEDFGFLLNPHDACVANKWVNGSKLTVTWHVADLKILHKDAGEATNMITYLESIYGPMTVKRVKKNTYQGMGMDFTEKGKVRVSMTGYIAKDVDEFQKDVTTPVVSPK